MKSLIMIAHGSKKEKSNNEFSFLVKQIKESSQSYMKVEEAFLEFATPSLEDSIKKCLQDDVQEIDIYPFFLNSGKHVTIDIPNIIKDFQIKYPLIDFVILNHFGKSDKIKDIVLSDLAKK